MTLPVGLACDERSRRHRFRRELLDVDRSVARTWHVDLRVRASQPTIQPATDGGYVVAWEQEPLSQDGSHLRFNYYTTWQELTAATPTKTFDAQRLLSDCAERTPNLYGASSTQLEFGFHFSYQCEVDQLARGNRTGCHGQGNRMCS